MATATQAGIGSRRRELETYESHKAELLRHSPGKYVLIKGGDIIGLYSREEEAFSEGYRRFRMTGFVVKPVQEREKEYVIGGSAALLDIEGEDAAP